MPQTKLNHVAAGDSPAKELLGLADALDSRFSGSEFLRQVRKSGFLRLRAFFLTESSRGRVARDHTRPHRQEAAFSRSAGLHQNQTSLKKYASS